MNKKEGGLMTDFDRIKKLLYSYFKRFFKVILNVFIELPLLILESLATGIYKIVKWVIQIPSIFIDLLEDKRVMARNKKQIENEKELIIFSKSIILNSKIGVFKGVNAKLISAIITFFLQITSYFTTLAGLMFIFSGINYLIPYILAGIIFLMSWYLPNAYFGSSNKLKRQAILMVTILILSISFSYIGTINTIINPLDTIEKEYTNYKDSYESFVKIYLNSIQEYSDIEAVFNQINNGIVISIKAINNHVDRLQGEIDFAKNNSNINANRFFAGYQSIYNNGVLIGYRPIWDIDNTYVERLKEVEDKNNPQIRKLNDYKLELYDLLGRYLSKIVGDDNLEMMVSEFINNRPEDERDINWNKWINMLRIMQTICQNVRIYIDDEVIKSESMEKIIIFDESKLKNIITYNSNYIVLKNTNDLKSFEEKLNENGLDKRESILTIKSFMDSIKESIIPSKEANLEEFKNNLQRSINQNHSKLFAIFDSAKNHLDDNIINDFENFRLMLPQFKSTYTVAFTRFNSDFILAFFVFLLAAFSDIFDLWIPYALLKPKMSLLNLNESKDICEEEEELLERLFESMLLFKTSQFVDESIYGRLRNEFADSLISFFKLFSLAPHLSKDGFILYSNKDDIEKETQYYALTAFLLELNYMQTITGEENSIKRLDYYGLYYNEDAIDIENDQSNKNVREIPADFNESLKITDDYIYIIKTKFLMWIIDSVSECFQTNTVEGILKELAEKIKNESEVDE